MGTVFLDAIASEMCTSMSKVRGRNLTTLSTLYVKGTTTGINIMIRSTAIAREVYTALYNDFEIQ